MSNLGLPWQCLLAAGAGWREPALPSCPQAPEVLPCGVTHRAGCARTKD